MSAPLYRASVPVFRHYLDRAQSLLDVAGDTPGCLTVRLTPDMFTCAEQFATAAGFALRGTYPLAGQAVPDFPDLGLDLHGVKSRVAFAQSHLERLSEVDFAGAEARTVQHRAGFAELEQDAEAYLALFAMPNFLFHLSMGFAVLRQSGAQIGKADFDGLHDYPHGFRF